MKKIFIFNWSWSDKLGEWDREWEKSKVAYKSSRGARIGFVDLITMFTETIYEYIEFFNL